MALIKEIELSNGVTVNYHRIVSVNNITNHSSVIEVASYTSKAKREEEKNLYKYGIHEYTIQCGKKRNFSLRLFKNFGKIQ